ncbi:hypothetical protein C0995_014767, partial [Termitomyces sp. Mi166
FVDRGTFVWFTGDGIGHCTTQDATHSFQQDVEEGFLTILQNPSADADDTYSQESTSDSNSDSEDNSESDDVNEDPYEEEILPEHEETSEDEQDDKQEEDELFDDSLGHAAL